VEKMNQVVSEKDFDLAMDKMFDAFDSKT
jgi:hypothetical protein